MNTRTVLGGENCLTARSHKPSPVHSGKHRPGKCFPGTTKLRQLFSATLVGTMAALGATSIPPSALAAEDAPAAGGNVIEEIVVRSKRGGRVSTQTMTEAVTAFSGAALEQQFAVTLQDFNHAIPNVQLEQVGLFQAAASFNMRGIGTAGIESFADPVVAVFVDDVYYSRNAVALLDLFDIESVTALRGPQGTLYGRNAFAGAITVQTKRPELNEMYAELHTDVGNYGRANTGIVVNMPLIEDRVALRVAYQYHQLDGFFESDGVVVDSYTPPDFVNGVPGNLVTRVDPGLKGNNVNGELSNFIRPSLRVQATDNWRIDIIGEWWRDKSDGTANWSQCYEPGALPPPLGSGPTGVPDLHSGFLGLPCKDPFGDDRFGVADDGSDPFEVSYGNVGPNSTQQDIWGITIDTTYDTDFGSFTLVANHREVTEDITSDTDGFAFDVFSSSRLQDYESTQIELRYSNNFGENEQFEFLGGFFYLNDEYTVEQLLWIFSQSTLFGGAGFTRDNPAVSYGTNGQERTSWATYAAVDWHFSEKWTLNIGGRFTFEKKDDVVGMAINSSTCPPGTTPATAACNGAPFAGNDPTNFRDFDPSVRFGPVDEDWSNFSPRVGMEYQLNDQVMIFGFWQRAFKSGGFVNNAASPTVFSSPYEPEQVDNFEIGTKADWFDGRLRTNLNLFYAEYEDLQRSVIRAANTSTGQETFTDNAAGATSMGVEAQISAVPVEGLTLFANVGWLDIEYEDFQADLTGDGISTDNSDLELVRAPDWDMSAGFTYEYPVRDYGTLTLRTVISHTTDMVLTTPNDVGFYREELTTVDAQIGFETSDGRYRFALWGKNLNEDIQRLGGTPVATLFAFAAPTQPRQFGGTVVVRLDRDLFR